MDGTSLEHTQQSKHSSHRFQLKDFEGPLDVLLFLIKKNEVSIYDIPIASITEQYLAILNESGPHDLDDLTDFYNLAATLIYLKSRMLLPMDVKIDDEIEDPRQDLVQRLIEYQKFKKLTQLMEEKEAMAEWYLERRKIPHFIPISVEENLWEEIEIWDLVKTFSKIMSGLSNDRLLSLYEEVSVNEKVALIYEFIETRIEFGFEDLITRPGSLLDLVCSFLAVLECCKGRIIIAVQHRIFGEIRLRGRPHEEIKDA